MKLADYDFDLPEDRIALRPAEPRDQARLLHASDRGVEDRKVADLPGLLRAGDVLVFNDTRVIPARLFGRRDRDGLQVPVEAILLDRLNERSWSTMMRPGKRLRPGDRVVFDHRDASPDREDPLPADVLEKAEDGTITLAFHMGGPALDEAVRKIGVMPLPPYIAQKRTEDDRDREDYQTVYARHDGSVAAPTAGLHFTPDLLARLRDHGVGSAFVTLHVGAGTFLPVKSDTIDGHRMHSEFGVITAETAAQLNAVREAGGRIIAVGTTSTRLLESAVGADGLIAPYAGSTDIFIRPGHVFRAVDGLMTNFHLPRSTLLMLLAAFAGYDQMRSGYAHAIAAGYRFYSYGDSSLWWRGAVA